MNYSTYRITLDVRSTVANVQLTAKKGDAGRKVYITLSDKGNPCEIADGLYAVFAGVKPDGTLLYNKTTIENNTIIYEMTHQTTAVPGLVACEVKLFDSMSNLLTSPKLTILVDDVVVPDEGIVSQNEITALAELILDATASSHFATEAANAAIAAAGNAQAATESANGAAASANQAAEGAITAASNANTAAGKATTEASKATQATDSANLATTKANNAASDARAATEETNTARENIVQTTGEILTSLSNAVYAPPVECSAAGEVVAVNDASNQLLHGLHIYGKTTQDGTPTPEAPVELVSVGESGAINTTLVGKNLINCVITATSRSSLYYPVKLQPGYYRFTVFNPDGTTTGVVAGNAYIAHLLDADKNRIVSYVQNGVYVSEEAAEKITQIIVTYDGSKYTGSYDTVYGQLESGDTATSYEPYNGQTIAAQTPNGLPGIPVSSGGNYTDENGQQWVCDEIDFARGIVTKKVISEVLQIAINYNEYGLYCNLQNKAMLNKTALCTHAPVVWTTNDSNVIRIPPEQLPVSVKDVATGREWITNNSVVVQFPLATPIETALSAEELAQFAALHSNKPNTTVYNDAGAGLAVEYVADTKNYIDNKFTELQNAILSAGANI